MPVTMAQLFDLNGTPLSVHGAFDVPVDFNGLGGGSFTVPQGVGLSNLVGATIIIRVMGQANYTAKIMSGKASTGHPTWVTFEII